MLVGAYEHSLEFPADLISAPLLGEFHRAAFEVAGVFVEHSLQPFAERKRVGNRSRKTRDYLSVINSSYLYRGAFEHHAFSHGYLSVARDGGNTVFLYGADSRAVKFYIAHNVSFISLIFSIALSESMRFLSAFFFGETLSGLSIP